MLKYFYDACTYIDLGRTIQKWLKGPKRGEKKPGPLVSKVCDSLHGQFLQPVCYVEACVTLFPFWFILVYPAIFKVSDLLY